MKCSIYLLRSLVNSTCLKWPLNQEIKFYNELHNVEQHWKGKVNFQRNKNSSKYVLAMFPYPSGRLHLGHLRVYSISDACSRYYSLNGFSVIHPIGWDAFGLPAENAAIQHKVDPEQWTMNNINAMKKQLQATGIDFDWNREISTCDKEYYKWTQWLFLKLFEHELARRTLSEVFWDPIDKTVLAAEQVDSFGRSWRSGAIVEKRKLRQWVIELPKYAKRLYDGLKTLRLDWGEVADIQKNWIGNCDVYRFLLTLEKNGKKLDEKFDLRIKNPIDLINAQFLVVTKEHSLAAKEISNDSYLLEETAFNFLNGLSMPIVVINKNSINNDTIKENFFMEGRLGNLEIDGNLIKSLSLNLEKPKKNLNMTSEEIQIYAESKKCGGYLTSRKLKDWVVSRQRSWGTPIPMILDSENKAQPIPVSFSQLPILSNQKKQSIYCKEFLSKEGKLESDTLDTFFDSSWYFLRFLDPKNQNNFANKEILREKMPVNVYVGGVEHADVHLFFARFICYFLHDVGYLKNPEPFERLIPQGIVRAKTFKLVSSSLYVKPGNVIENPEGSDIYYDKISGEKVELKFEKMSKSKMNGIDPLQVINEYGMDMSRTLLLDAAAPRENIDWGKNQESDFRGLIKFIERCASIVNTYIEGRTKFVHVYNDQPSIKVDKTVEKYCQDLRNNAIRRVMVAIELQNIYNTAIEKLKIFSKALKKIDAKTAANSVEFEKAVHALIIMLQIFLPHIAAELWTAFLSVPKISTKLDISNALVTAQNFPKVDKDALIEFLIIVNKKAIVTEVPRQFIEHLSLQELFDLAKKKYHKEFFNAIEEHNVEIKNVQLKVYQGLRTVLYIELKDNVSELKINKILQNVRTQKLAKKKTKEG